MRFGSVSPLFLRPIVERKRFLAPRAPERFRNGILGFRCVATPLRAPTFAHCSSVRSYGNAQRWKHACFHLCAFVPRGALGVEQGDFVRYIGARAA